jgi:hypothetical protein
MNTTQRKSNRRGNYSIMMGFSVLGILGFGALGVDISYIAMANTQAQAVSDAASHAALVTYRSSTAPNHAGKVAAATTAANWIVNDNQVGINGTGTLAALQFGQFNSNSGNFANNTTPVNAVRAQVERKTTNAMDLLIAPFMGFNEADIEQMGTTVANPREIVLVIDRSCSMGGTGEVGTGNAIQTFAQYMLNNKLPLDTIGAVEFQGNIPSTPHASIWRPMQLVEGNEASIAANWTSSLWQSYCCNGNTDQAPGVQIARNMLNATGNDLAFKAIIVISDGNPCCGSDTGPRRTNFLNQTSAAYSTDDIHVWTVGFGGIDSNLMFDASRGLGRPANVTQWNAQYRAPNAAGVEAIVRRIAESIPVAFVE